jgi:hypothetical protein
MTLKVDHKEKFSGGPLLGHVGPTIIFTHSSFIHLLVLGLSWVMVWDPPIQGCRSTPFPYAPFIPVPLQMHDTWLLRI